MIVEQFLPAFHYGDAIGNSTLRFHRHLVESGINSQIVALTIDENMRDKAIFFRDYESNPDSIKILHFAIPSELSDFFKKEKGRKVIVYHNITPPEFFVDFSEDMVRFTKAGRNQLRGLNGSFDLAVADSEYNAGELRQLGFNNVKVFPIMIDLAEYNRPHSDAYLKLLKDERRNIIFVGRITPNKRIEDLIKVLFFYKKYISPSIRLIIAGKTETLPKYFFAVRNLASRFLLTSDDIIFTGHVPFDELLAVYKLGDIFLSLSEHEGFCLPLIESCFFQVPVIAYDAGSVAETLQGAGIILKEKKYDYIAGLLAEVMADGNINELLRIKGQKRIENYKKQADPDVFLSFLQQL